MPRVDANAGSRRGKLFEIDIPALTMLTVEEYKEMCGRKGDATQVTTNNCSNLIVDEEW